ncbi:MAG: hypothetical protein KAS32_25015 [Candidatus Peribacteraceae bacterium]|nr:hypothetical protein [Candidatus Peribacteraceae bacterium]
MRKIRRSMFRAWLNRKYGLSIGKAKRETGQSQAEMMKEMRKDNNA